MSQLLIIGGSLAAIVILVLINRALPIWQPMALDEVTARARFAQDFYEETVRRVLLSDDGQAALLVLARAHRLGLVMAMGDGALTRLVGPDDVVDVAFESTKHPRVMIRLDDFSFGPRHIKVRNRQDAEEWIRRLRFKDIA